MDKRDWQKDYEMANKPFPVPYYPDDMSSPTYLSRVYEIRQALNYWLQRVNELEEENHKLREVVEAAKAFYYYCGCSHYSEASYTCHCGEDYCSLDKLRLALAALDGGEKEGGAKQ